MSITVNVNGELKELVEMYYNDNGTIRKFKEVWTNNGTDVRCLFQSGLRLEWSVNGASNSNQQINSVGNDGYTVNFTNNYKTNENAIRSNKVMLTSGQVIKVSFNYPVFSSGREYSSYISLLDENGNVVTKTGAVVGQNRSHALTISSTRTYQIALNIVQYISSASSYTATNAVATITIE